MSKTDSYFNPEQYATVAERIEMFYSRYPHGRINTELVSRADGAITFKAVVFRDANDTTPAATGWASEREGDSDINTVACLENTETSAVGRALANLGFVASAKRPSREEMEKVFRVRSALAFGRRRESPPSLQTRANARDDVLELLDLAEQRGFSARRGEIVRGRVAGYPGLVLPRIRKIETALRNWVRRHEL
ncbi:MAG TPA: hypothetical protein VJ852_09155 [Gemmatimonadaceae bacterium]|nr:hypothetical protein [Gemmatimonadaceae bacterium]